MKKCMKHLIKFISVLLVISSLIITFAACKSDKPDDGDKTDTFNLNAYQIVRKDAANENLKKMTSNLKKAILEQTKAELKVATDYVNKNEPLDENTDKNAKEILIGDTNRAASTEAMAELKEKHDNGYIIKVTENKIAIVGTNDNNTIIGMKAFIKEYVMKSDKENSIPVKAGDTVSSKVGEIIYTTPNLDMVTLDKLTTIFDPGKKSQATFTYGKVIKLENQPDEKNNGIVIATNEQRGDRPSDPQCRYPVYKSMNDGDTWEHIAWVGDTHNKGYVVGYQPSLLELPVDMGEFKKGTIFMAGCTRNNAQTVTLMTLHYSTDLGQTWTTWGNIAKGGAHNINQLQSNAIWEPILMYEEETKRLYCFYSDEMDDNHSQKLVYKYTTDMKTWSDAYDMVANPNKVGRPGMVSIAKMGNGKYALVYENGHVTDGAGYPIYIKIGNSLSDWGDPADMGKMINSNGKTMGSGPVAAWSPNGGECGTLFVTANGMSNSSDNDKCDLFMSFDYGETFVTIKNPIRNKHNSNVASGYSPGMYVDKNGDLYYVNDPERDKGALAEKLMFAKIVIY